VPGDVRARVRDELLGAVDHPLAVLEARAGLRVAGVAAGLGLGQPERAEPPPRAQVGQVLLLLLLGAEQVDRLGAQRRVRAHRDRNGRVDARELLDRQRVGERVAARAAVLLGERDPHEPELAQLGDDLVREALLAVELLGHRRDLVAGEVADGLLDEAVVVGEVEEHGAESSGAPLRRARRTPCASAPCVREYLIRGPQPVAGGTFWFSRNRFSGS
jgi:hypothetical protein